MDPTETCNLLSEAINDEDWGAARDHANDLRDWLSRGGFLPHGQAVLELMEKLTAHFAELGPDHVSDIDE